MVGMPLFFRLFEKDFLIKELPEKPDKKTGRNAS
jgi:hypothetical protein